MVEPGETRVNSEGVEDKKVFKFKKEKSWEKQKCDEERWSRCARATEESWILNGWKWSGLVPEGTGKIAAVCFEYMQE